MRIRLGIDLGGTKIEIVALGPDGTVLLRQRQPTPGDYTGTVEAIGALVEETEAKLEAPGSTLGIGVPGSPNPITRLMRGANSTFLNGQPFGDDLSARLQREVRVANDANCMVLSEATDGAAAGASCVFGVILGSGVGGGLVVNGRLVEGRNGIGGEWGHNPLPWMRSEEHPGPACFCGHHGCIEQFCAGPALARDCDGPNARNASTLPDRARKGDTKAQAALARHADRLARALAHMINIIDPEVIVLGGGLSNMAHLYTDIPPLLDRYAFTDAKLATRLVQAMHGDSSGVFGAARLWDAP